MAEAYSIHWFRRDLRIAGNPALAENLKKSGPRVLGFFCFDRTFLERADFSPDRFQFFLETLNDLRNQLQDAGSDLLVIDAPPGEAFASLVELMKKQSAPLPTRVSWNRDYEPFARKRDHSMEDWLKAKGIETLNVGDHLLIEPHEVHKGNDPADGYIVYTPFAKRWLNVFQESPAQERIRRQKKGISYLDSRAKGKNESIFALTWSSLMDISPFRGTLERYRKQNSRAVRVAMPLTGSRAALDAIRRFRPKQKTYSTDRDYPALAGTSRMSIYFKNGSFTVAQAIAELGLAAPSKYLGELIWREFYYHILFRYPHVENEPFQRKYADLKWENDEKKFEAWKSGLTGYPIVDAAMRELNTTGWMHNRMRMVVASFLTKDLLIDWRWGEKYFMNRLLDGDLAPNNGGWQWAASTGCDPQPYFRIFNPLLQSRKFDPRGDYIRAYVPELAHLDAKEIHDPAPSQRRGYPAPIVDHAVQRERALAMYKRGTIE